MGLDMWVEKKTSIVGELSGNLQFTNKNGNLTKIDLSKVTDITEKVASWRKVYFLHEWFIENVHADIEYWITKDVEENHFKKLYDSICAVIDNHDLADKLLPNEGVYDEYYFKMLSYTKEKVCKILEDMKTDFMVKYTYNSIS